MPKPQSLERSNHEADMHFSVPVYGTVYIGREKKKNPYLLYETPEKIRPF